MYSIDGVPLQNPSNGWRFKRTSEPKVVRSFTRADFNASGRDGTIQVRGYQSTPTMTLVVSSTDAGLDALCQLLALGASLSLTTDPTKAYTIEAMTVTPATITPAGPGITEVTVVYRLPKTYLRDVNTTDWQTTIPRVAGTGAANLAVLTGSSAPVRDALILIQGGMSNPKLTGSNGTWISYTGTLPAVSSNQGLLIDAARGRCWMNPSSDWWDEPGSNDQSGQINTGAYPYFLELAPSSTATGLLLGISWSAMSENCIVTVRGRNAYMR